MTDKKKGIHNLSDKKGYPLKTMIAMIEKEAVAKDIPESERIKMAFLSGYLKGMYAEDKARTQNLIAAVNICKKLEFKYLEVPKGKAN